MREPKINYIWMTKRGKLFRWTEENNIEPKSKESVHSVATWISHFRRIFNRKKNCLHASNVEAQFGDSVSTNRIQCMQWMRWRKKRQNTRLRIYFLLELWNASVRLIQIENTDNFMRTSTSSKQDVNAVSICNDFGMTDNFVVVPPITTK